jgi:hypothetical protein
VEHKGRGMRLIGFPCLSCLFFVASRGLQFRGTASQLGCATFLLEIFARKHPEFPIAVRFAHSFALQIAVDNLRWKGFQQVLPSSR